VVKDYTEIKLLLSRSYFPSNEDRFVTGLYCCKVETTDRSSSKQSKWEARANQEFGWGKFSNFICTLNHRTLGAVRRTAPIIISKIYHREKS